MERNYTEQDQAVVQTTEIDNIITFSRLTCLYNDLDPVYEMLYNARFAIGPGWTKKFCLHFLMFYHMGEAAKAADIENNAEWWHYIDVNFDTIKRGTERRHYRGKQGRGAFERLRAICKYTYNNNPALMFDAMYSPNYFELVRIFSTGQFARTGFGEYFIWKVADFQRSVFERPINMLQWEAVKFMPQEPRQCAHKLYPDVPFPDVVAQLRLRLRDEMRIMAPPSYKELVDYQEVETILCMVKGFFLTKTHTFGDDIVEKHEQLKDFPNLKALLPKIPANLDKYVRGEYKEVMVFV